jgi:hypothetical protein
MIYVKRVSALFVERARKIDVEMPVRILRFCAVPTQKVREPR